MQQIAIIGISGLFPGSSSHEEFWDNLLQKKDLTQLANKVDFGADPDLFFDADKGVVDKCYSLRGGFIRDFNFDAEGFELPAKFLAAQDKLYQWSLFTAKEALKDSGYLGAKKVLEKCGLILGNLSFPTSSSHRLLSEIYTDTTEEILNELFKTKDFKIKGYRGAKPQNEVLDYTPSKMVQEALGLGKTHYALDAACATSLYAIKLACDELETGKADLMLAGAVCASDQLFIHMGFSIFHAYAPSDKEFVPLDKDSSGLVSSEGAGMVVLKRLADAERDNDNILGVIGGIGLSNDGRGKFLLSPNPKGQKLAFKRAYTIGDLDPKDTSYLECHATGTPLGDVTEMNSIADFFEPHKNKPLLGSVKSNMGHLLTAAGMTGLLKVLLSMEKNRIPANINLQNAVVAENNWVGKSEMILEETPWEDQHKQAGINSFGFGGTNAHMVVKNHIKGQKKTKKPRAKKLLPLSIIGMDVHFGDCANLNDFYHTIYEGKQHFKPLPQERWKGFEDNKTLLKKYGFKNGQAPKGAFIEDFEIDLLRYKIQPKEAETLEPQQALILKVADRALQDAGIEEGQNVAVLIAMEPELAIHHYLARWDTIWQLKEAIANNKIELSPTQLEELEEACKDGIYFREGSQTPSQHTSFVGNIMASRIAALWDFTGPAFTVSGGDDSVFKAMEIAQNLLSLGEVDAVVVGGVDFSGGLENVLLRNQKDSINTSEKPSLSFNKNDDGWLIGEGAGAIVLKKSTDITSEKTYATIDEIGGTPKKQAVDYIELAATGIKKEDQIEIDVLNKNKTKTNTALGSIKSNIGNTFAASGIAAIIKTALCLHHRFIPAIPNWDALKNDVLDQTNYYFPSTSRPWIKKDGQQKRNAAVNGVDGIQLQLSEGNFVSNASEQIFLHQKTPQLIALKGADANALRNQLSALDIALDTDTSLNEIALHFHEQFKTKKDKYCLVLVGNNKKDLKQELTFFNAQLEQSFQNSRVLKTPKGSYFTPNPLAEKGKTSFVYPGSSTAYTGLGQDLFQLFPDIYQHFEGLVPDLEQYVWSKYLYPALKSKEQDLPNIYEDAIAMMSTGVFFSSVYTHILKDYFKINADIAFGYSMGECSSMWYAQGLWDPKEAEEFQQSPVFKTQFAGDLNLLAEHWNITTDEAKDRWVSLVLLASVDRVKPLIEKQDKVYLTFINTANEVVISGDKKACLAIAEQLNCQSIQIPFQNVIHHDFCSNEKEGLIKMHNFDLQSDTSIEFYSSITQSKIELDSQKIAQNSTDVCCQAVNFPKTVDTVYEAGARIFIELGANATCTNWIKTNLKDKEHLALSLNQKGKKEGQNLIEVLAQLVSHGVEMDLSILYPTPASIAKKRSFYKKINPGGKRYYDEMLSDENRKKYANIVQKKQVVQPIIKKKQLALSFAEPIQNTPVFTPPPRTETTIPIMDTKTIEKTDQLQKSDTQVGENGLRLQNYESGEHLNGKEIIFSQADLVEFAEGKIAKVFGDEYNIIDTYSRRVMLPMDPYLLVSRVTGLNAKINEYKPSTMQTEYDIPYNAWFTTDRQIPWAVSVESGQCDLLLISYLGIDFQNKGDLVYRLLDCTLTFTDDLPFEGQTLRYDISINSFVKNGDNLLFFFSYRCYVEDRLVLKMDGGCAGFFTPDQLSIGNGVVYSAAELKVKEEAKKRYFTPLLNTDKTSFNKEELLHLINGDIEKCFGNESYFANGKNPSLCLPPEKILMLDRITSVDLTGGAYGLGYIVAEKDLHPDDWYFPCHFRDDEVLAGSLQAEGGGNLLRFFMLMLGMQRLTKDARYQPIYDIPQKVRCRKEVSPGKDTKLVYKLEIKEIGLIPNPYVIGDLEIISDGIVTVHFENLGLQLREKDNPKYLEKEADIAISPRSAGALLNEKDITTFALDDLSKCFGEEFAVYDGRKVSRQPNTDLQLISRVLKVEGTRGYFKEPSTIYAEYDVPNNPWYYAQNAAATMPYSVLMEIALQPCGLLGAYLGSTLQFADKNLYFRNLNGDGEMVNLPEGTDFRGKVISNKSVLVSSVSLAGTVLQNYTFELSIDGKVFYKGKSSFGFFPGEALAQQVGLDKGTQVAAWYETQNLAPSQYMQIKLDSLYGKMKLFKAPAGKPQYRLSNDQLKLIDNLRIVKDGGEYGKGYVHATRFMKLYDWFFTCHFYQDPVMPGSLGVEAILQAMQVFALQQNLGKVFDSPKFVQLNNHKTDWKYRGQILQGVDNMHLEVHIKSIEMRDNQLAIIADAFLWNEQTRIYHITNIGLGIENASVNFS